MTCRRKLLAGHPRVGDTCGSHPPVGPVLGDDPVDHLLCSSRARSVRGDGQLAERSARTPFVHDHPGESTSCGSADGIGQEPAPVPPVAGHFKDGGELIPSREVLGQVDVDGDLHSVVHFDVERLEGPPQSVLPRNRVLFQYRGVVLAAGGQGEGGDQETCRQVLESVPEAYEGRVDGIVRTATVDRGKEERAEVPRPATART